MGTVALLSEEHQYGEAFVAELSRLEREVNQVNQQLDRLEVELRRALGELARERFEGYQ
ncbi:MAG: hypothetical protein LC808_06350 [Actinobacteria bacterium]|nr:hypothetical protein [Actinomycetota bacterium]